MQQTTTTTKNRGSQRQESQDHTRAVFTILDRGDEARPFWLRIGTCFENRDGSLNVYLDAIPRDGKLQIRTVDAKNGGGA